MLRLCVFLMAVFCAPLGASDMPKPTGKKSRISIILVNQPSVRKLTFKDKISKLPTITFTFPPYTDQSVVTKTYPNGTKEELSIYLLPMDLLTTIATLNDEIAATNLRGIINITPRFFILYPKCFALFKKLLKIQFNKIENPHREFRWYHLW